MKKQTGRRSFLRKRGKDRVTAVTLPASRLQQEASATGRMMLQGTNPVIKINVSGKASHVGQLTASSTSSKFPHE